MGGKWNRWETPVADFVYGKRVVRKEYNQWAGMYNRCGKEGRYENVTLSENFKSYDWWYEWASEQKGFLLHNKDDKLFEIDKDIVGDGTMYSEDVCVFVPKEINALFKRYSNKSTGVVGVHKDSWKKSYRATFSNGYHKTVESAHTAYLKHRLSLVEQLVGKYKTTLDERVINELYKSCEFGYFDIPDTSKISN